MSYNTRRSGGQYGGSRGSLSQNFVSAGQFQTTSKPLMQTQRPQVQKSTYQSQSSLPPAPLKSAMKNPGQTQPFAAQKPQQFTGQQPAKPAETQVRQQPAQAKPVQQPQAKPVQQAAVKPATTQAKPAPQQPTAQPKPTPANQQPSQVKEEELPMDTDGGIGDEEVDANGKKKSFWRHIKTGKISKKEKRDRRNLRLRKILQPKNALMVLNELIGGQKYTIIEAPTGPATTEVQENFAASVVVDGQEYMGHGKNKNSAKSSAAENALRNILLTKLRPGMKSQNTSQTSLDMEGDVQMTELDENKTDENKTDEKADEDDVSWLHVASYAIHKLFDSWDAYGMLTENAHALQQDLKYPVTAKSVSKRPAKQLPANAELMNPVMLLNQMRPGIMYEDFAKEGSPPSITFTVRTICDGEEFFGKGNNKKIARKNCAYAACSKLFDIHYENTDQEAVVANTTA